MIRAHIQKYRKNNQNQSYVKKKKGVFEEVVENSL
jgi:hypothetical protein